jgi:hypothetical protein
VLGVPFFRKRETCGVVAQLGERLNGIQEAASSILASSTNKIKGLTEIVSPFFLCCPVCYPNETFIVISDDPSSYACLLVAVINPTIGFSFHVNSST